MSQLVTTVTISPICEIESNIREEVDINSIIKLLQENNYLQQKSSDVTANESMLAEFRLTDVEGNNHYGSLTSGEIDKLIEKVPLDKNKNNKIDTSKKVKSRGSRYKLIHKHDDMANEHNLFREKDLPFIDANEANVLNKLLLYFLEQKNTRQNNRDKKVYNVNKIRAKPIGSLDDYSKVYVILDPFAIRMSKSEDLVSNLSSLNSRKKSFPSGIMKLPSLSNQKVRSKKREYYKGFPVKRDLFSRRSGRDSRESFGPKESVEDSYKQKRSRNEHVGGGGGGRTAIPYIRHRGDIYERDN